MGGKEGIRMMNVTFSMTDILNIMNTKASTITKNDIVNDEDYKAEIASATAHNTMWTRIETAYKTAGIKDPDVLKAMTDSAAGGPKIDVNEIDKKYIAKYQDVSDTRAKAEQVKNLELGIDLFKEMGLIDNGTGSQQIVSAPAPSPAPAPAPAPTPTAPAESRMSMAERKAIIRDMVGTGTGTNQFRRHCSTTAQANEARALIERWRSLGYITGGQKAELRAEVNAAAWLGHCGVTATR